MIVWWCTTCSTRPAGSARVRPFRPLLVALFGVLLGAPRTLHAADAVLLVRDTTVAVPASGVLLLPDRFVVRASEAILLEADSLRRGTDYTLDYAAGELRILRFVTPGLSLRARYRAFAVPLASAYARRARPLGWGGFGGVPPLEPASAGDTAAVRVIDPGLRRARAGPPLGAGQLSVAGTKTFSLQVGSNRDAVLQQSLDLSLSGTVAPNVRVAAALSDQNLPLSAEGASTTLHELDRAWISVTGPGASAVFGDFDLASPASEFATFSRRLSGVHGAARTALGDVQVAAASSRGRWITVEVFGRDGIQGPYPLLGAGSGPGDIVQGSERVWLDGVRLRSGEEADYVLDDVRGYLTLSPRHPVSSRSRVVVDLQVGERESARMLYTATSTRALAGDGAIAVTVAREADGGGAVEALSAADRAVLAAAGDSIPAALLGVHEVGAGAGDYVRVPADSTAPEHFAYAGPDSGDVRLDFLYVGAGRGDYAAASASTGGVIYVYVGASRGTHTVGRIAEPPVERTVVDLRATAVRAGPLRVAIEGALSHADLNTLSSLGDGDNVGHAAHGSVSATDVPLRLVGRAWGTLSLSVDARDRAARYEGIGRVEDAGAGDRWGLGAAVLEQGAQSATASLRYAPVPDAVLVGDAGRLRLPDGSTVRRVRRSLAVGGRAVAPRVAPIRAEIARETLTNESPGAATERRRDTIALEMARGGVRPSVHLTNEERTGSVRDGAVAWDAGVSAGHAGGLTASIAALRRDDRSAGAGPGGVHALGVRADVAVPGRGAVSGSAEVLAWRARPGTTAPPSLARAGVQVRPQSGVAHAELVGRLSTRAVFGDRRDVRYVGAGLGHYDSLGVYVGQGDYEVAIGASSDTTRASELSVSLTDGVEGARLAKTGVLSALRASHFVSGTVLGRGSLADLPWSRGVSAVLDDPRASSAALTLRQDVDASLSPASARYRWERTGSLLAPYVNQRQTRSQQTHAVLVRVAPAGRGSAEIELTLRTQWGGTSIAGESAVTSSAFRVEEREARITLGSSPAARWRVDATVGFLAQDDDVHDARLRRLSVQPSLAWTPRPSTRLAMRAGLAHETRDGIVDLGLGPLGTFGIIAHEYHASADHRVAERVTVTLAADGTHYTSGSTVTSGRAEVRASF